MQNFTPVASLAGGILIGLASAAMLLLNGKIAGVSGICAGLLMPARNETLWRACFVAGLLAGGAMLRFWIPAAFDFGALKSSAVLAAAGLLVGFGTRLGNGCTSGHGVCGVSRLSARSIFATATFMACGAATVFITDHVLGGPR
ncbi:MAG: YeeE/YedE thiosulfate transporter family protein [Candidatus Binatus sp.]|uniref:YeeE/YedE family protein n=1 Tax=Candidatus Binatus sp. TaxID=2811406 RepID=UPI00272557BF|nr:YeeE/YedE thiosulfate transporter family protein [Candidatus Binatus sp.]MDO8432820.1 YeeE/YedE thiosulfate transporter family protein [Candidatus Binatus sp.]